MESEEKLAKGHKALSVYTFGDLFSSMVILAESRSKQFPAQKVIKIGAVGFVNQLLLAISQSHVSKCPTGHCMPYKFIFFSIISQKSQEQATFLKAKRKKIHIVMC